MYWELWDTRSKNLVETFDTEDEAMVGIRELLAVNRPDLVDDLALGAMSDDPDVDDAQLPPALSGEILRARLAETAERPLIDDASRAVHEKIRRWLTEEGWHLDAMPSAAGSFNIVALLDDGQAINISQQTDDLDHLTLSLRWPREYASKISGGLPEAELDDVIWSIYRDVSVMGVDLHGIDLPSTAMALRTDVYFDGLTKDTLMHRIALINRAYRLAMRAFVRASRSPDRAGDRAASSEVLRQIVRPVPQTGGPLTVAS